MKSEIITIGDELLIGQIINTNQAYIASRLNALGISVERMTTVGDDEGAILASWDEALRRADAVIVTGGLGPTHDDITKKAACKFFQTDLVPDAGLRQHIQELLQRRSFAWSESADEQTRVPRSATLLPNPVGTAAGLLFEREGKYLIILPGVPYEMKEIVDGSVVPFLAPRVHGSAIRHLTLRTTGIAESLLAKQLGDLDDILRGARLAFLPSPRGVRLRITMQAENQQEADRVALEAGQRIRAKAGKYIYGTEEEELEEVLGRLLIERKLTLAVAESCTGGLIADRITNVSGSSAYFERGIVAYSNRAKTELLGVPESLIASHGAVSSEVATEMAAGVRRTASADIGLSTTGIAGPTGGSDEKPVGLLWIGYADSRGSLALRFTFGDVRTRVKERASQAALELVRRKLLDIG